MVDLKHIVNKVGPLFKKFGIKSITMDDVSRELGMSKKTLYQVVHDKNELVELVINTDFQNFKTDLSLVNNIDCDAVLHLLKVNRLICRFLSGLSLTIDFDLRKYHIELYDQIRKEYLHLFHETIVDNIRRGTKQNLYRADLDEVIITKFHVNQIEQIPYSKIITMEEYTSKDFVTEICRFHLNGLVNENGRKLLEMHKNMFETIYKTETI